MPPAPKFDTLEMVFHVIDEEDEIQILCLEVDMDRYKDRFDLTDPYTNSQINDAGIAIVKELVVV